MNTRLIKETRDLLPIFAGSLLLIAAPYLIFHLNDAGLGYALLGLACAVMGGSSFGNEFQHRTISLLLAQPIARSVLWRDKMLILGGGMLASLLVLVVCLQVCRPGVGVESWLVPVLISLCAFCGAPCWTLLLRHGIGGMVCAVAIPGLLLGVNALLTQRLFDELDPQISVLILVIYCGLVYWLGYATFKRLEAVDGPRRELGLPAGLEAFFVRPLTRLGARFQSPFAALLKKEYRLQQISFLLAGLFCLVAAVGACLINYHRDLAEAIIGTDCFIYVMILPLIAGATAVAEEKGWGIAEWHLTLPPCALEQWSVKMLAVLSTGMALGLVLPVALFLAGSVLFSQRNNISSVPSAPELLCWTLGSLLLTSVAIYAASISKNTLRAILGAVGIIVAAWAVCLLVGFEAMKVVRAMGLSMYGDYSHPGPELIPLLMAGGLFLMLCVVQWFAWSNFRRSGLPARKIIAQIVVMLLTVGLTALVIISLLFFLTSGYHLR